MILGLEARVRAHDERVGGEEPEPGGHPRSSLLSQMNATCPAPAYAADAPSSSSSPPDEMLTLKPPGPTGGGE
jgi:hypothetical protein